VEIQTRDTNDIKVVELIGKLDTNTSPDAETHLNKLIKEGVKKILVNLEKLDYVSSAGLRVLLSTNKQLQSTSGLLRICNLNEVVQEIFDISGFSSIFNVFSTESEALNDF
jgi:anti-sigma B factor antagonist